MPDETAKQKNDKNEKGKTGLIIVCAAAAFIIIALICVIIFMMGSKKDANELSASQESEKRPMVVIEENAEEIAEQILNQTEEEDGVPLHYQVTMNSTWEFDNGQAESSNAYVSNSTDNETAVYFDVIRNDTQNTIYQSPVIPIGQELSSITLDEDLDAGNYECTLIYHLIDDEQNTLTTVNMWLMIVIKS